MRRRLGDPSVTYGSYLEPSRPTGQILRSHKRCRDFLQRPGFSVAFGRVPSGSCLRSLTTLADTVFSPF